MDFIGENQRKPSKTSENVSKRPIRRSPLHVRQLQQHLPDEAAGPSGLRVLPAGGEAVDGDVELGVHRAVVGHLPATQGRGAQAALAK